MRKISKSEEMRIYISLGALIIGAIIVFIIGLKMGVWSEPTPY